MAGTRIPGEPAAGTPYDDGFDRTALDTANSTEGDSNFTTDGFDSRTVVGWESNYTTCERSGFRLQDHEVTTGWDGLITRKESMDHKHPAEFSRVRVEESPRGSKNPEPRPDYLPFYNMNMVQFGGAAALHADDNFVFADADTEKFTISLWLKRISEGSVDYILQSETGGATIFRLYWDASDNLAIDALNTIGGKVYDNAKGPGTVKTSDGVVNLLMSWASNGSGEGTVRTFQAYAGDTQIMSEVTSDTRDIWTSFGYASSGINFPSGTESAGQSTVWAGDLWWDNSWMDLSVESSRRKFHDINGHPVDLGYHGDKPTGAEPLVFFGGRMRAADWNSGSNRGSSTGWSMSGTVSDVHEPHLGR